MSQAQKQLQYVTNNPEEQLTKKEVEGSQKQSQQTDKLTKSCVDGTLTSHPLLQDSTHHKDHSLPQVVSGLQKATKNRHIVPNKFGEVHKKSLNFSSIIESRKQEVPDFQVMIQGVNIAIQGNKELDTHEKQKRHVINEDKSATKEKCRNIVKSAITLMEGTTKPAPMFNRLDEPKGPKSTRCTAQSRAACIKTLGLKENHKNTIKHGIVVKKTGVKRVSYGKESSESKESSDSSSSDSDSSETGYLTKKARIKKPQMLKTKSAVSSEAQHDSVSEVIFPVTREDSVRSICTTSVKSASELLEEARGIVKLDTSETYNRNAQQNQPESLTPTESSPVTVTAKSIDEVIASLRSAERTTARSTTDEIIKELMEKALGKSTSSEDGDNLELESEPQAMTSEALTTEKISTDLQKPSLDPTGLEQLYSEHIQEDYEEEHKQDFSTKLALKKQTESTQICYRTEQVLSSDEDKVETKETDVPSLHMTYNQMVSEFPIYLEKNMDREEAMRILSLPEQVTYEEIMHVKGDTITIGERSAVAQQRWSGEKPKQYYSFPTVLTTWTPTDKDQQNPTVHYLCTATPSHILPIDLQMASKIHHTSGKLSQTFKRILPAMEDLFHQEAMQVQLENSSGKTNTETPRVLNEGVPISEVHKTDLKDDIKILPPHTSDSLTEWQKIAEYYVEGPRLLLLGKQVQFYVDAEKLFWTPAPPKFSFPVSFIQENVFPKFESSIPGEEINCGIQTLSENNEGRELKCMDPQDRAALAKVLSRRHRSLSDIRSITTPFVNVELQVNKIKKTLSAPSLSVNVAEAVLKLPSDFKTSMKELAILRQQLTQPMVQRKTENTPQVKPQVMEEEISKSCEYVQYTQENDVMETSQAEPAKKAEINFICPKKTNKTKGMKKSRKTAKIFKELNQPPRTLTRSESLPTIYLATKRKRRKLCQSHHPCSSSLPSLLNFEKLTEDWGGIPENVDVREWVRGIWNAWFDEVFPDKSDTDKSISSSSSEIEVDEKEQSNLVQLIDFLNPVVDENVATISELQSEISQLSELIKDPRQPTAFHYCRRGALKIKLGQIKTAKADLNTAICIEPLLLDARWHRHLIYLLQDNDSEALEDLNFITKHKKNHADAYQSKAEIYRRRGDITMALLSYSQAIKYNPQEDETYFRRAQLYESRNDMILAMEDYSQASQINPCRTDALIKHGFFCFENSYWSGAIQNFTILIPQDPQNAEIRMYRGRALIKIGCYQEAIEDFSAAVHLDPNNWLAFYHRGCLLRKVYPHKAMQDLSISVLINDSFNNLNAFLHRGILYTELNQLEEAVCDFRSVLNLDSNAAVAYLNIGLISLRKQNYYEAIRQFGNALRVDPTYIRAYMCRARTYHTVHNLQKALKDLTCAIHLQPTVQQLYILRGQYLYEMKKLDLASFCIQHAAEMNQALGSSPIQQAAVHSFLQNHNKAIQCLVSAVRVKPVPSLFILLGKTQMKAKKSKEAVESFKKAIEILDPLDSLQSLSPEAGEVFYLMGICYMDQVNLLQALGAFNNAVKICPNYADAYYQRGLCRMRLQQAKCIQDFNRALTINPKLFQAYLSRAAFYGIKEKYTKAILNCNEAIKIQPWSLRAYLYRGALKYYKKAYACAAEDFTSVTTIDKNCTLAYYNRAVCYHQLKESKKALKDYGVVLLLGSRKEIDLKVLINRGLLYLELNDYYNALQDFVAATLKFPDDSKIYHALGICHHRLKQLKKAVKAFNHALKLDPILLDAYIGRGNVYMDYGHETGIKQAQRDFIRALHLNPLCLKARINLGYNFQVLGKFQRAWNQFTIALDIDPKCQIAYEGRAVVSLQMGATFPAFHDITAALKLNVSAQLLTNRGVIQQLMGGMHNAMKDYQAAISLNQNFALAYFNAANLYFYDKRFKQANKYYSKAIHLDPNNESAVMNRGITCALLRNGHGALKDFEQAINLNPYSAHAYFNRGNFYSGLKQYHLAEKDYSQALVLQPNDALLHKLRADVRGKLCLKEEAIADYKQAITIEEGSCFRNGNHGVESQSNVISEVDFRTL
ncbi:uncharacterized protein TTC6 [Latimeria chalumnae]|uniref:uncharacterized protein TTC6 n=1 Tax=Latimeria chalumnae TaxID=7897 RepID=UPI0006D8E638|nr:PREDICTED: tetratricopeptide repeat protein 6 [Latimeria chalumnae]|eukprot:XP_014340070.1 PREDICTED: tetratricopeptide repeat protein 6 [Latimeria chalumnae]